MIGLTRLNGRPIVVNAELIETIESTPDTVIALITGKKLVVLEGVGEVVDKVINFRRRAAAGRPLTAVLAAQKAAQTATHHED